MDIYAIIGISAAIIAVVSAIYHMREQAELARERDEIMRWAESPEAQERIREMEARGGSLTYSKRTSDLIKKARRYQ